MKNKLAFLTMLVVAFFAGMVGLSGCGDKYANLNIKFVGNEIQTNEKTGVSYIEVEYDEKDSSNNDLSFTALLDGYDDSMRTGLTLVVPQDKILINSSEIKGAKTTFNVTLLTSGIIPVTIYSIETSKVFVKFEIRALLKTKELTAKQKNLNLVRPSGDDEIEYKLIDEDYVKFTPANSTARGVTYELGANVEGVRISGSSIFVSKNASVGVLPIIVKSNRMVSGTAEFDANLTDLEKQKLSTTIYAFVYDNSWKLNVYSDLATGRTLGSELTLSVLTANYPVSTALVTTQTIEETEQTVQVASVLNDVYFVYNSASQDTSVAFIEENDGIFNICTAGIGQTKISFNVDLYYVPNLADGQVVTNLSSYRKLTNFQTVIEINVVQTATAIQLTTSSGIVSTTAIKMNVFKATEESINAQQGAYVDVNILPLTANDDERRFDRKFVLSLEDDDNAYASVYYVNQNNMLSKINFDRSMSVLVGEGEEQTTKTIRYSPEIACGVGGVRIYIAFVPRQGASQEENPMAQTESLNAEFKLTFSSIQTTDIDDVVSTVLTCSPKEAVSQIEGVNQIFGGEVHLLTKQDDNSNFAYIGLDDKQDGILCSVKFTTDSGSTLNNQTFVITANNPDIVSIQYVDNLATFKMFPKAKGSTIITIVSENNITYTFTATVVVGIETFSIGYVLESGAIGQVKYFNGEFLQDLVEEDTIVKTYGLKSMYLQRGSRIKLKINEYPTDANITIGNGVNAPFKIEKVSGDAKLESQFNVDKKDVYLNAVEAGECSLICEVKVYIKNDNGIWNAKTIKTSISIYIYNPINSITWNVNGQAVDGDVIEIYDIDALSYDKQPIYPNSVTIDFSGASDYYLSRTGFNQFILTGTPSMNASALAGRRDHISFVANILGEGGRTPNYITSITPDGMQESDEDVQSPWLQYSVDYTGVSEYNIAAIWGTNAQTVEYPGNNSVQAFSSSGVWLGFTSIPNEDSAGARAQVYEYKITALIVQAKTITARATLTLRIVQPKRIESFDVEDEYYLEAGGIANDEATLSFGQTFDDVLDDRYVFTLSGEELTYLDILNQVSGTKTSSQNSSISFDKTNQKVSLASNYASGDSASYLTLMALDSVSVARKNNADKYAFGMISGVQYDSSWIPYEYSHSGYTPIHIVQQLANGSYNPIIYHYSSTTVFQLYLKIVDEEYILEHGDDALVWVCYNEADHVIVGETTTLPVYKIVKVNINAGDTPNNAFKISSRNEFEQFVAEIYAGNTFKDKYIKLTSNIYGVNLSALNGEALFEGVLFAESNANIYFENAIPNIFGTLSDASIQNITFVVKNELTLSASGGLIAKTLQQSATIQSPRSNYAWDATENRYVVDAFGELKAYGLFNVHIVVQNNITATANDLSFAFFVETVQNSTIKDCSITLSDGVVVSAQNVSGFADVANEGDFDHCILRMYGSAKIDASGTFAGIARSAESLNITYSYVLAFDRTQPNIEASKVCAFYALTNNTAANSFITANIEIKTGGQGFQTFVGVENCFANLVINTATNSYTIATNSYVYIVGDATILTFDGFDFANVWTLAYPSYNNGQPLLFNNEELGLVVKYKEKRYIFDTDGTTKIYEGQPGFDETQEVFVEATYYETDAGYASLDVTPKEKYILYDTILTEINCAENSSAERLDYGDPLNYKIDSVTGDKVYEGETGYDAIEGEPAQEQPSRIVEYVGASVTLSAIVNTTSIDNYDIDLQTPGDGITFERNGLKNVGNALLTFHKAGEWEIVLKSAQNKDIFQKFVIVVIHDISNMELWADHPITDVATQLVSQEGASVLQINALTGNLINVDVINVPNDAYNNISIKYAFSEKTVFNYGNSEYGVDSDEWQQENDGDPYIIVFDIKSAHAFVALDNLQVSYSYILNCTYNGNVYASKEFTNDLFVFTTKIIPNVSVDVTEAQLYTSDTTSIKVRVTGSDDAGIELRETGTSAYLNVSSPIKTTEAQSNVFNFNVSCGENYKGITTEQTITLKVWLVLGVDNKVETDNTITIKLLPTPVASITATYYQNGQVGYESDSERTSHIITPGGLGLLKIDVLYDYSRYDYIEVWSSELQGAQIFFTQYYYDSSTPNPVFREIPNGSIYGEDGKLRLQKQYALTGEFFVTTYLPNNIEEDQNNYYTIFVQAIKVEQNEPQEAFQCVEYLVSPGYVSRVDLLSAGTQITDGAVRLVTQGQTFDLSFAVRARNATISYTFEGLSVSDDVSFTDVYGSTLVRTQKNFSATVTASNGQVASIRIRISQNDMIVQDSTYNFVVVDKVITNLAIHNEKDGHKEDENVLTIGTNSYSELLLDYTYWLSGESAVTETFDLSYLLRRKQTSTTTTTLTPSGNMWYYLDRSDNTFKPLSTSDDYADFLIDEFEDVEETQSGTIKFFNTCFRLRGVNVSSGTITLEAQAYAWYTKNGNEFVYNCGYAIPTGDYFHLTTLKLEFTLNIEIESTEDKPLLITNVDELRALKGVSGGYYMVTNDLNLDAWEPFDLSVVNLDFNGHKVALRSLSLSSQQASTSDDVINAGIFSTISENTTVRNLILDVSKLVYVDATDKTTINFGFVAGINNGIVYNVDVLAFGDYGTKSGNGGANTDYVWEDVFNYKINNNLTGTYDKSLVDGANSTQDTFNYNDNRLVSSNTKQIFNELVDNGKYQPSVFILTGGYTKTITTQQNYIGGIAGVNNGYITNSRVGRSEKINVNGKNGSASVILQLTKATTSFNLYASGNVGGLCGQNNKAISSSYYNGGYVINSASSAAYSTKTAGLVAEQTVDGRIYGSFARGVYVKPDGSEEETNVVANTGGVKSQGSVAGLVHTNEGTIENCYANIPLQSSSGVGGLVFANEDEGIVKTSLSLSKIKSENSVVSGLFVGVDTRQNVQNSGTISNCYYLEQENIIVHPDEKAIGLNSEEFANAKQILYGFSLTTNNTETDGYIWLFNIKTQTIEATNPGEEPTTTSTVESISLIGAEKVALGMRDSDAIYFANTTNGSENNPINLTSVYDWNRYFDSEDVNYSERYYRLIADIDFEGSCPTNSMKKKLEEIHFEGNGLAVKNITFINNQSAQQTGTTTNTETTLGLFGEIEKSTISGLNITLAEGIVSGNTNYVGALAGKISESTISNIAIQTESAGRIVGYNFAGGLAGYVEQSTLSNISSQVSVSASYIANNEGASYTVKNLKQDSLIKELSYAGGIAGAIISGETGALEPYTADFLVVDAPDVNIFGEHAGGVVGYLGLNVVLSSSKFVLAEPATSTQRIISSDFIAGGLVAENKGLINKCSVDYVESVQKRIDTNTLTTTDLNTTLGSLPLFGNAQNVAIGGLVGWNVGGGITNSYTRAEVVNNKAYAAGGLIGLATQAAVSAISTNDSSFSLSGIGGVAISEIDCVYTTSFVYAKNSIGGLIGVLSGTIEVSENPTILALNKNPNNENYNFNSVANKGRIIGYSHTTNNIVLTRGSDPASYVGTKYGIYVITEGNENTNEIVFDREIGNYDINSGVYNSFVDVYPLSYIKALKEEVIIFNGFAANRDVWVVDELKSNRIMPTLIINKNLRDSDIISVSDWNAKLKNIYDAKVSYVVNLTDYDTAFESITTAKNFSIQGAVNEDVIINVNVGDDYKPLFQSAENITITNLTFKFKITTNNEININSLICGTAKNCIFNNVKIIIENDADASVTGLHLGSVENFGSLVGNATNKITVYNCSVSGVLILKSSNVSTPTSIGGLVGIISPAPTTGEEVFASSSLASSNFGNIEINLNGIGSTTSSTETVQINSVCVGGVVGRMFSGATIRGNLSNVKFDGSVTADAGSFVSVGGMIGHAASCEINSVSATIESSSSIGVSNEAGNVNIGGIVGSTGESTTLTQFNSAFIYGEIAVSNAGTANVGGIVGQQTNAVVNNALNNLEITLTNTGTANVGGIVGQLASTAINSSVSAGDLTVENSGTINAGGIAGNIGGGTINNSVVYTNIKVQAGSSGTIKLGGFAGSSSGTINKSCAYGMIVSKNNATIGGAVASGGSVQNCVIATGIVANGTIDAIGGGSSSGNYYAINMIGHETSKTATQISLDALTNLENDVWGDNPQFIQIELSLPDTLQTEQDKTAQSFVIPSEVKDMVSRINDVTRIYFVDNRLNVACANIRLTQTLVPDSGAIDLDEKVVRVVADGIDVTTNSTLFASIGENTLVSGLNIKLKKNEPVAVTLSSGDGNEFGFLAKTNNGLVFNCALGEIPNSSIITNFTIHDHSSHAFPGDYGYDPKWSVVEITPAADAVFGGLVGINFGIVSQTYAYVDFDIKNNSQFKFGGLVGENSGVVQNNYIIGRQIWSSSTNEPGNYTISGSGTIENNNYYYVYVYYDNLTKVKELKSNSSASISIWKTDASYNYGIPMFKMHYDTNRAAFYTGNGRESSPYEIFDFEQLKSILTSGVINDSNGYFVLARDVIVIGNAIDEWKYHLNGNGNKIRVKSYTTDSASNSAYGVFKQINSGASVYNANIILYGADDLSANWFGGLALKNNSDNIHDVSVLMNTGNVSGIVGFSAGNSVAGGLFAETSKGLNRCWGDVYFSGANCQFGALVGQITNSQLIFRQCMTFGTNSSGLNLIGQLNSSNSTITITFNNCYLDATYVFAENDESCNYDFVGSKMGSASNYSVNKLGCYFKYKKGESGGVHYKVYYAEHVGTYDSVDEVSANESDKLSEFTIITGTSGTITLTNVTPKLSSYAEVVSN